MGNTTSIDEDDSNWNGTNTAGSSTGSDWQHPRWVGHTPSGAGISRKGNAALSQQAPPLLDSAKTSSATNPVSTPYQIAGTDGLHGETAVVSAYSTTPSSTSQYPHEFTTTTPKASMYEQPPPAAAVATAVPTIASRAPSLVQGSLVAGSPLAASEIYSVSATGDSTSSSWIGRFLMSKRSRSISKLSDMAEHLNLQQSTIAISTSAPVSAGGPAVSTTTPSSLFSFPWPTVNTNASSSVVGLFPNRRRSSSSRDPTGGSPSDMMNHARAKPFVQPEGEQSYKNSARIVQSYGPSGITPLAPLARTESQKKLIPIMMSWPHGGKVVYLTGTFNNWKKKVKLTKSSDEFSTVVDMPSGTHRLKFIKWLMKQGDQQGDGLDGLSTLGDETSDVARPDSPLDSYTSEIPAYLRGNQLRSHRNIVESLPFEPPPTLPAHLQRVLLNSKNVSIQDPYILPVPTHVTLNHLYACSIRDGVMAIGCTTRYRKKYITTVLYKPVF
ncbi:hypothetical protein BASA60_010541 [Batrachochytrium salamandrivorans]|nr:hypothetical protein BASA60_010541 [Batrachochytrium salamandrivorans]